MSDEMAQAHAKDMEFDRLLRETREKLNVLYDRMGGRRRFAVSDAIDAIDEERAAIVQRWD